MAEINPYAAGSCNASAETTQWPWVSFNIDRCMPIACLILACMVMNSVRVQLNSTPMRVGMIPNASVGVTLTLKNTVVLFMTTNGQDKLTVMRQDGTAFSRDELIQSSEIIEYLTIEMESGQDKNHVKILGDTKVQVGQVARIQTIIGDAFEDIDSIYVAVKEE